MNPMDCIPVLTKCGDVIFEYLKKYLTDEQISDFLRYMNRPRGTYGQAFRYITQDHGQSETIFEAIVSLERIRNMCDAAESSSQEPLSTDRAFHVAYSALNVGMLIGMIADDDQRKALIALAQHGKKFASSVGKHGDLLNKHLESHFQEFRDKHGKYPTNKDIRAMLEKDLEEDIDDKFIHSVDDDGSIEWGKGATKPTSWKALETRFTKIRKKLKENSIKKSH